MLFLDGANPGRAERRNGKAEREVLEDRDPAQGGLAIDWSSSRRLLIESGEPSRSTGKGSPGNLTLRAWGEGRPDCSVLTLKRPAATLASGMSAAPKRATIYLPAEVHRALRLKAAAADRTISDLVGEAVRMSLAEDAEDIDAFEKRARERSLDFENVVKTLRRRGKL